MVGPGSKSFNTFICAKKSHGTGRTLRISSKGSQEMWSKPPLNGKAEAKVGQGGPKGAEPELTSPPLHPRPARTPTRPLKTASILLYTVDREAHQEPGSMILPAQVVLLSRNLHSRFCRCLLSSQALRNLSDQYGFALTSFPIHCDKIRI